MKRRAGRLPALAGARAQGGAAILAAMLTVVLVATLATTVLWQQWRAVEVEAAERTRTQSVWVLSGALDWARLILREDARQGGADHLGEPWAVPLEQARLSTFLAADRGSAQAADATQEAFLAGRIVDLQSRLNVTNLVLNGKVHEPSRVAFARLFDHLGLPASELELMVDNLRRAHPGDPANPAAAAEAAKDPTAPLWPQDLAQLAWVGLSAPSIAVLRPFVTVLPTRTPVNLNTAPAEVIYACVEEFELADAHRLVTARSLKPLTSLADVRQVAGEGPIFDGARHGVKSDFFEVAGSLRLEQITVQVRSVVQREGLEVKTIWRQRDVAAAQAPLQ